MHDVNRIRRDPEDFDAALARRGVDAASADLLARDTARREAIAEAQALQTKRNEVSKKIGQAKGQGDAAAAADYMAEVAGLKEALQAAEERERQLTAALDEALSALPNEPLESVPDGADENANVEIRKAGAPVERDVPEHFEIGEALAQMDFDVAAKLSGSRFVVLRNGLARERALGNFMLDLHVQEFGYSETVAPVLVRDDAVFGTGQLPKFAEDLFRTEDGYWLTPTAEVTLTNLVREEILAHEKLPLRFAALTQCFRSEAGAAGRDTRGMIRQHQFSKVELVSIVAAEHGEAELERKTQCAETVLQKLELPYRTMLLAQAIWDFRRAKPMTLKFGWRASKDTGKYQAVPIAAIFKAAG